MKTVLVYGDSQTWGRKPGVPERMPFHQRWTSIMAEHLGPDVHVIVEALNGRGLIHQGEKRHAEAIEDFTAVHGLVPQRADPLVARATSYLALDRLTEAASDLDEGVQSAPTSGQAWSMRGLAYERLGDKKQAAACYNRAIAIRPRDEAARSGLARVGG